MGKYFFLLGLVLLGKAASADDNFQLDNVFGEDDRKPVLSAEYPWSTIGRLDNQCTATLVAPTALSIRKPN